jgi:hypothetical protein
MCLPSPPKFACQDMTAEVQLRCRCQDPHKYSAVPLEHGGDLNNPPSESGSRLDKAPTNRWVKTTRPSNSPPTQCNGHET